MSILGNILGMNKGKGSKFPRIYATAEWFSADKACQPGQWNKVGEITVPAQQEMTFGANDPVGGGSIAGRSVYLRFDNTSGAQLHGKVRFVLSNGTETRSQVVAEERTNKLSADQNDRAKCVLLPEFFLKAKENDKLQIFFYPDSATAVTVDQDGTNTLLLIPVTVYQ